MLVLVVSHAAAAAAAAVCCMLYAVCWLLAAAAAADCCFLLAAAAAADDASVVVIAGGGGNSAAAAAGMPRVIVRRLLGLLLQMLAAGVCAGSMPQGTRLMIGVGAAAADDDASAASAAGVGAGAGAAVAIAGRGGNDAAAALRRQYAPLLRSDAAAAGCVDVRCGACSNSWRWWQLLFLIWMMACAAGMRRSLDVELLLPTGGVNENVWRSWLLLMVRLQLLLVLLRHCCTAADDGYVSGNDYVPDHGVDCAYAVAYDSVQVCA